MKKRHLLSLLICMFALPLIIVLFRYQSSVKVSSLDSWIGEYRYEEYSSPNMGMSYVITVYENDGLSAYIKIDGFQTLKRLKTKVWIRGNEALFLFYQYYTDEDGNNTFYESYSDGDNLLKLKKEKGELITEWGILKPMLPENEKPGQYFKYEKD